MKTLFEPVKLGSLEIKNRLIRSATMERGAIADGRILPLLGDIYEELVNGGVGLIITGMMGVAPNACLGPGMVKIYGDSFTADFRAVAERVHALGGQVVIQLGHCGIKSEELDGGGYARVPSALPDRTPPVQEMTVRELKDLAAAYGAAAARCREAGADGVQIHAAHGYLISEFLSPIYNRRTDEYGGPEGRGRLLLEVYDAIRQQAGADFPILVKINHSDIAPGGVSEEEVMRNCAALSRRGIDGIEISCGIGIDERTNSTQGSRKDEAFNADFAIRLSGKIDAAVISVGGYRSYETCMEILNKSNIAAISMSRALIRRPDLPNCWKNGDTVRSECVACRGCFTVAKHGCLFLQRNPS